MTPNHGYIQASLFFSMTLQRHMLHCTPSYRWSSRTTLCQHELGQAIKFGYIYTHFSLLSLGVTGQNQVLLVRPRCYPLSLGRSQILNKIDKPYETHFIFTDHPVFIRVFRNDLPMNKLATSYVTIGYRYGRCYGSTFNKQTQWAPYSRN